MTLLSPPRVPAGSTPSAPEQRINRDRMARVVLVATLTAFLLLLAAAPPPARAAWVDSDYPSSVPCGVTIPVEQCDPAVAAANAACRDMCHYGGRRGGRCVSPGRLALVQGCHCKC